jgi:uncharacterized protein YkwD
VSSLPVAPEVGRQWVELIGHGTAGPEVLALFPLEVGREPSRRFVGTLRRDESSVRSTEQAEELLADMIRRDRRRFDLPDLERDPALDAVARGHSREMATAGYFAHISPVTGSVADRLRARAYPASFAAENIAMAASLSEAEEGLMRSPGHRAAILSRRTTRFGVGVATTDAGGMGRLYLVTQVFVATHGDDRG